MEFMTSMSLWIFLANMWLGNGRVSAFWLRRANRGLAGFKSPEWFSFIQVSMAFFMPTLKASMLPLPQHAVMEFMTSMSLWIFLANMWLAVAAATRAVIVRNLNILPEDESSSPLCKKSVNPM